MGGKFDEGEHPLARTKCVRKFWELGLEVQYIEMTEQRERHEWRQNSLHSLGNKAAGNHGPRWGEAFRVYSSHSSAIVSLESGPPLARFRKDEKWEWVKAPGKGSGLVRLDPPGFCTKYKK